MCGPRAAVLSDVEEERRALGADIRDIYTEAGSAGFDVGRWRCVGASRSGADHLRWQGSFTVGLLAICTTISTAGVLPTAPER